MAGTIDGVPGVNGTLNGFSQHADGVNGHAAHTPAHSAFDSIPDVINAFGALSLSPSRPLSSSSPSSLRPLLTPHRFSSKRRIRHSPRRCITRKRRRPHNRCVRPHPRKSLVYDQVLVGLHLRSAPRLSRRRAASPSNGDGERGSEPNRIYRHHRRSPSHRHHGNIRARQKHDVSHTRRSDSEG
jgi:hypothetical protein